VSLSLDELVLVMNIAEILLMGKIHNNHSMATLATNLSFM
jgi:hypothetical protein